MANEVLASAYTNMINTEYLDPMIGDYLIDFNVVTMTARLGDLRGKATKTWSTNTRVKNTAAAISELGSTTNVNVTTTKAQITGAKFGIRRQYTVEVAKINLEGEDGFRTWIAKDAARLLQEKVESDLAALFPSFTNSVSHSTLDMSLLFHLEAMATMRTNKVPTGWIAVYATHAASDLMQDAGTSMAAVLGNPNAPTQNILNANSDGTLGVLFQVPCKYTNLTVTANAGADVVSAMYLDARAVEDRASLGYALLWMPESMEQTDVDTVSTKKVFHMAGGAGITNAATGLKIITGAT